ncbi:hypothetical protein H0H92_011466 [Tricholoma furcatifolium]|nr:hypothetical protein H0H92_011466 [Tricholoma furcatifolium]
MLRSLAIISLAAVTAFAQTTVPTGISSGCSSFLTNLNTNTTITTCLSSVTSATSNYSPGSAAATSSSAAQVGSTLGNLCSSTVTNNCPESMIRSTLTNFLAACNAELTSTRNTNVQQIYDMLYALVPLKNALCAEDDSGNYCATQTQLPTGETASGLQAILSSTTSTLNFNTFASNNILFMFLNSTLSSTNLCTVCSRNIVSAYLNFEVQLPYGPGLGQSILLAGQSVLYNGMLTTCGSTFFNGAGVQAAGGLSGGTLSSSNGAVSTLSSSQGFVAIAMGALAVFVSSAL